MKSRTQRNRKGRATTAALSAAVGPVWPTGRQPTEQKLLSVQNGNYQLYHNTPVTMTNTLNLIDSIAVGTASNQRIGNRIFLKSLRANIVFNNKGDRPNVSYRVAVTAAPTNTNTDSFAELFASGGFTGIHVPQTSLLLHDATFPLNQGSGMETSANLKERSFNHTFVIPLNHPATYSPVDGKCTTTLTTWFIAYDAYGTLIVDNIASVAQVTWALDYTDS